MFALRLLYRGDCLIEVKFTVSMIQGAISGFFESDCLTEGD